MWLRCVLALHIFFALGDHSPPTFVLNLDIEPLRRWDDIVGQFQPELQTIYDIFQKRKDYAARAKAAEFVIGLEKGERRWFPNEQYLELEGISKASNIPLVAVATMNLFYDLTAASGADSRACTSIVVESDIGEIHHGRNLDYDLELKEILANLTAVIDWQRAGKTLFSSVSFVGMVGFNTVVRPGAFSISHDERDKGSLLSNLWDVFALRRAATFSILRQIAEDVESFSMAKQKLARVDLSAPSYFIVGGTQSGEGAIITRDHTSSDVFNLDASTGRWYLVETNYDHWDRTPADDDRRDPSERFLNATGRMHFSANEMMAAISNTAVGKGERPTLNADTVYSAVISAKSEAIAAIVRGRSQLPTLLTAGMII